MAGIMRKIGELGERWVISTFIETLDLMPDMPIPFGDDVAAIPANGENLVVLKTDMLVGKTDVPPGMSLRQAARKAVVMNVSDFAAKGIKPIAALVSLGLPADLTEEDVKEIAFGLNDGAREYEVYIVGGDTNEAEDLIICFMLVGYCKRGRIVKRSGARPGDIVAVTGPFGKTSAGLKILLEGLSAPEHIKRPLIEAVLMPRARLKEGLLLAGLGALTASIDSSDGLAWSLHELSEASGVGFIINNIPIAPEVEEFATEHSLDPLDLSLYGGEEYELVVTIKPEMVDDAKRALENIGEHLTEIGRAIGEKRIEAVFDGKRIPIERRGWEHFKNRGNRANINIS
ncbi:thiamine-phosphate kinase [Candidatus Bathyarchaeota archaeon]|nr:thiamine-phosphate kinase [Candidatus Bathyarchaeota archaeon]